MLADSGTALDAVVELTVEPTRLVSGCSSGPRSRAAPTTPPRSSGTAMEVYLERDRATDRGLRDRGLLVQVDGMGSVDEVTERIFAALSR
jgi:adenylate kinase